MTWEPTAQELNEFIWASELTYGLAIPSNAGLSPYPLPQLGGSYYQEIDSDGFYAATYQCGSDIIVAFEGTVLNPLSAYGWGSLYADAQLALGQTPATFQKALQFTDDVIQTAGENWTPGQEVFVTGHSLGGAEAEYVSSQITGLAGATFGAPGIPLNYCANSSLIDYVDYGDPFGNFATDSMYAASGNFISPLVPAYHVGTLTYVGSPNDATSAEFDGLAALVAAGLASPLAPLLVGKVLLDAWQYHSLDGNYAYAAPETLTASSTSGGVPVDVTGSIDTNLSENIVNNITSYSFASLSASLTLNDGEPLTLSVTALPSSGIESWNSVTSWDAGGILALDYLYNAGFSVADFIGGVLDLSPMVFWQLASTVNTLENIGPSNGSLTLPGIGSADVFGVPLSVDASVQLTYNVTVGAGADVLMDQPNVDVRDLIIDPQGTLSAGSNGFTVDDNLTNQGSLQIVAGPGGRVQHDFVNSGVLSVDGQLQINGNIYNDGAIEVNGSTFYFSTSAYNTFGTIEVGLDGTIVAPSGIYGGTLATFGSGVIEVGGELTDVTIGAGTQLAVMSGWCATLTGSITDPGTISIEGAPGAPSTLLISGTLTLAADALLALSGSVNTAGASGTLVNQGGTIAGQGSVSVSVINEAGGLIDADVAGQMLLLSLSPDATNHGLWQAINGGTLGLVLGSTVLDDTGGTIQALGASTAWLDGSIESGLIQAADQGLVQIFGGTVSDATLSTFGSGVIELDGELTDVTIGAGTQLAVMSGWCATLAGSITDPGTISIEGAPGAPSTLLISGTLTLAADALLALSGSVSTAGASGTLVNQGGTIAGQGSVSVSVINEVGGLIDADLAGQSVSLAAGGTNRGLIEATDGGTLYSSGAIDETRGVIQASGGGICTLSSSGPIGNATVTGTGSELVNAGEFVVGGSGTVATVGVLGTMLIENGGLVETSPASGSTASYAAAIATSEGTAGSSVSVVGANSTWQVAGNLDIGEIAEGSLTVASQGTVTASATDAGVSAGAAGVISVYGIGSNITDGGQLTVGDAGVGELSITNGATVTATNVDLGLLASGSGNIDIEGAGSTLVVTNNLNVGDDGHGVLTVGQGATLEVDGNLNEGITGVLINIGGIIDPVNGTLGGNDPISNGGTLVYTGTLDLTGTISVAGGTGQLDVGTLTGPGVLDVGDKGTFVLADGNGRDDSTAVVGSSIPTIGFVGNAGTLTVEDASLLSTLEITSFATGGMVDLPNLSFASTSVGTHGTMDLLDAGGGIVGDVLYGGEVSGATLAAGIVGAASRFASGLSLP